MPWHSMAIILTALMRQHPNNEGGGKRDTKGHYDVPMRDCTVMLDNDTIIDKGIFVDQKMIVDYVPR